MSTDQAALAYVELLLEKGRTALATAKANLESGDTAASINRLYYACFYALSAALFRSGRQYVRHAAVRAAMHQHLVHAGRLSKELGRFYARLFDERHQADYVPTAAFTVDDVRRRLEQAREFLLAMEAMATGGESNDERGIRDS